MLSDNVLDVVVSSGGALVNNATVTVAVYSPTGGQTLATVAVPFVANGLYEYIAPPSVWPVDGTYRLVWTVVDTLGRTKRKEQSLVVVK